MPEKKSRNKRLSWDELFMNMAISASDRTACKFHQAGAVFVDNNHRVISVGYNGPTVGDYHCLEVGCAKIDGDPDSGKLKRCRGAHAEMNAIVNSLNPQVIRGSTLYTTLFPCYDCMKILNNAGVREIVYKDEYLRYLTGGEAKEAEDEAWELARKRGIGIRQFDPNRFLKKNNDSNNKNVKRSK